MRKSALPGNQNGAHLGMSRDRRHCACDIGPAYLPGDIAPVDADGVLAAIGNMGMSDGDLALLRQLCQSFAVENIYSLMQREPGDCAIHCSGVDIQIAQALRQLFPHRTFARTRRSVDCDSRWPLHARFVASVYKVMCTVGDYITSVSAFARHFTAAS